MYLIGSRGLRFSPKLPSSCQIQAVHLKGRKKIQSFSVHTFSLRVYYCILIKAKIRFQTACRYTSKYSFLRSPHAPAVNFGAQPFSCYFLSASCLRRVLLRSHHSRVAMSKHKYRKTNVMRCRSFLKRRKVNPGRIAGAG